MLHPRKCRYYCAIRIIIFLMAGLFIIVPDVIWTSAILVREKTLCSEGIQQVLTSCNYQETTSRMSRLSLGGMPGSVSMQAVDLQGLTSGQGSAKPVVYLYKRIVPDSTSATAGSPLAELMDKGSGKENLGNKINEILNHTTVDAKDLDFELFDSLLVSSLKSKDLYAPYSLELKRCRDTLEVIRHKSSPGYSAGANNVTLLLHLNAQKTVWYELDIKMGNLLMTRLSQFLVPSIMLILLTILLLFVLGSTIRKQNTLNIRERDFIHILSHDLRSPVSNISLSCEMLMQTAKEKNDSEALEYSRIISRSCDSITGMIESIIPLSERIQSDAIEKTPVHLYSLVSKVAREFRDSQADVLITIAVPRDCVVSANYSLLEIIFRNLIDNAIKYSKERPEIEIRYFDDGRDHQCVSVSDNGIGIRKSDLPLVFSRFYRGNNSSAARGFGLGLYSVKEFTELLGWRISVKSKPGRGSTFTLHIDTGSN